MIWIYGPPSTHMKGTTKFTFIIQWFNTKLDQPSYNRRSCYKNRHLVMLHWILPTVFNCSCCSIPTLFWICLDVPPTEAQLCATQHPHKKSTQLHETKMQIKKTNCLLQADKIGDTWELSALHTYECTAPPCNCLLCHFQAPATSPHLVGWTQANDLQNTTPTHSNNEYSSRINANASNQNRILCEISH
jgi:hypothetical protein